MKKRLNVLCILVLLVLSYSVISSMHEFFLGVREGAEIGFRHDKAELEKISNMHLVALMPDGMQLLTDSVYNVKSEEYVPVSYDRLLVSVKAKPTLWQMAFSSILPLFHIIFVLIGIVLFIRIVISVNKSNIFTWKNVSNLRWMGLFLALAFLSELALILFTNSIVSDVLVVKGYSISVSSIVSTTNLVLGVVSLIIAEVFAIGLRMREEQELTI